MFARLFAFVNDDEAMYDCYQTTLLIAVGGVIAFNYGPGAFEVVKSVAELIWYSLPRIEQENDFTRFRY